MLFSDGEVLAVLLSFKPPVRLTAGCASAFLLVNDVAKVLEMNAWKLSEMGDLVECEVVEWNAAVVGEDTDSFMEMIDGRNEVSHRNLVSF